MPDLPRGTVTFLFTDIEGSTRLLKELGRDRYGEFLAEHQRLLRAAFAEAGGEEIDTQGDAFFVAFRSAADAVSAAVAAQRALATHDWPDGIAVRVRMGIHTGEAAVATERYLGLAVHRAARICAAGHGGQVLLSNTTRELVEDELPADVGLRDLGEQRLKDLDRPERLSHLVIQGLPDDFAPLKTLETQPAEATPFAGREGELAEAARAAVTARRSLLRRELLVPALAGVLAAAVAIPVFALGRGDDAPGQAPVRVATDSVAVIDPKTNEIVANVRVGNQPSSIAAGEGAVWVVNAEDLTISRIDPETRAVRTIRTHATPSDVAVGEGAVWVANGAENTVSRIDPRSMIVERTIDLPPPQQSLGPGNQTFIAAGGGAVWVAPYRWGPLWRIDPQSNEVVETIPGDGGAIAVGEGAVWIVGFTRVSRVDPTANEVAATVEIPYPLPSIATGAGAVWASGGSRVFRIDPRDTVVAGILTVAGALAVSHGSVWVAQSAERDTSAIVWRVDPSRYGAAGVETISENIVLGDVQVTDIAVGEGFVWVAVG
jgi:YVTN family beta-propeller protein